MTLIKALAAPIVVMVVLPLLGLTPAGAAVRDVPAATTPGAAPVVGGELVGWYGLGRSLYVPDELTGRTVIAAAGGATLTAVTDDGAVTTTGSPPPAALTGKFVTAVAIGDAHTLALTSEGTVVAWGNDNAGQIDVPASLTGRVVTAIAAGGDLSLALTADGTVTAWGDNSYGQRDLPSALAGTQVVSIATSGKHSLALTSTGSVIAWGYNDQGQSSVPASLTSRAVVAVATGGYHSLAVTSDGQVTAWGLGSSGQLDVPAALTGKIVTAVSAGLRHSVALDAQGRLYAWGAIALPAALASRPAVAISSGQDFSLAILRPLAAPQLTGQPQSRTVNEGRSAQFSVSATGLPTPTVQWQRAEPGTDTFADVPGATGASYLVTKATLDSSGARFRAVLSNSVGTVTSDPATLTVLPPPSGEVVAWGADDHGESTVPAALVGKKAVAVAAGQYHNVALTDDGAVTAWGDDAHGQTDIPDEVAGSRTIAIAAGAYHSLALTSGRRVVAWGEDGVGQTDVPDSLTGVPVAAIAAGGYHNLALTRAGQVVAWGWNDAGQADVPAVLTGRRVVAIAAGAAHSVALTSDGSVVAWGSDEYGETDVPAELVGARVLAVAAGGYHSLALVSDARRADGGRIVAWGADSDGQSSVPGSLNGRVVTAVSAGFAHSMALTDDGEITGFGADQSGESSVPDAIVGRPAIAISAGNAHSLAIVGPLAPPVVTGQPRTQLARQGQRATFTVSATGGPTVQWQQHIPGRAAPGGSGFTDIPGATGRSYTTPVVTAADNGSTYRAMLTNAAGTTTSTGAELRVLTAKPTGELIMWGRNTEGQSTVPSSLIGHQIRAVSPGAYHTLALTAEGAVVGWGLNSHGELNAPISLADKSVIAVAAGTWSSLALTSDGRVTGWGYGPVAAIPPELAGRTVVDIAADGWSALALTSDGTIVVWGTLSAFQIPPELAGEIVVAIAVDDYLGLVQTSDGTLIAWGFDAWGATSIPTSLSGKNITAFSAGRQYAVVLTDDGVLTSWGLNIEFQTDIPPALLGKRVTLMDAGAYHSLAVTSENVVVAWGYSEWGDTEVPAQIAGRTVVAVESGPSTSAVLVAHRTAPIITAGPSDATVAAGDSATFTVAGSGEPTPTVTWQRAAPGNATFSTISGVTGSSYTVAAVPKTLDGSRYRAILTNSLGSVTSAAATLTVQYPPGAPTITGLTAADRKLTMSFAAGSAGKPATPVSYLVTATPTGGGAAVSSAAAGGSPITLTGLVNGRSYRVTVTARTRVGSATSSSRTVVVGVRPTISGAAPDAIAGTRVAHQYRIGGLPTPTVTVRSGGLPPGLTLTRTGALTGTATRPGTYRFTLAATNATGAATVADTVVIKPLTIRSRLSTTSQYYGLPVKLAVTPNLRIDATVTVTVDGRAVASRRMTTGALMVTLPNQKPGRHAVRVVLTPTNRAVPAVAAPTAYLTIKAKTSTVLRLSRTSQTYLTSSPITLLATVSQSSRGAPAGRVVFKRGTTVIATVPVRNGVATTSLSSRTPRGSYLISATFVPTSTYVVGSTSRRVAVRVI